MPHIEISVNVPENSQAAEALEKDLYENLTKAHDKPIDWFMINIKFGQRMTFAGKADPCAFCRVTNINFTAAIRAASVKCLTEAIVKHLGVAADRIYIDLQNRAFEEFGWNGATFA